MRNISNDSDATLTESPLTTSLPGKSLMNIRQYAKKDIHLLFQWVFFMQEGSSQGQNKLWLKKGPLVCQSF